MFFNSDAIIRYELETKENPVLSSFQIVKPTLLPLNRHHFDYIQDKCI